MIKIERKKSNNKIQEAKKRNKSKGPLWGYKIQRSTKEREN